MFNQAFHFEIHDLLTQFVAAMDDVVISRHDNQRNEKEKIKVRYVNAPKERVLLDIVNKAQNITVPVIAVNVSSISRDETRVFNKIEGFYHPVNNTEYSKNTGHVPMPVPVNLTVSVNIITNYQSDMDQIISNFVPYSNPYLIICWKVPEEFNLGYINEIRSEVLWDGSINIEYPTDPTSSDKPRFLATTSFIIKGWLFPESPNDYIKNIYFIDSNFRTTSRYNLNYDSYDILSKESIVYPLSTGLLNEIETVSVSGVPLLTNIYLNSPQGPMELSGTHVFRYIEDYPTSITILGQNLQYTTNVVISSSDANLYSQAEAFEFVYYPNLSGYVIPNTNVVKMSKNVMYVTIPRLSSNSFFNLAVMGDIGWVDNTSIDTKFVYLSA
jgi:hypothetical protein